METEDPEMLDNLSNGVMEGGQRGDPKFSLLENFLPNIKIWGWKFPIVGEFKGKIEILSTHNLLC